MDPLAHTLFGGALAETGLKKVTPLATAALLIGANLPDIDGVASLLGPDASLHLRRGWTHGVLAMALLPLALAGALLLYDRFWRRRRAPEKPPTSAGAIIALSYLGVLSHPLLDWLNTYGVRLLMPFDDRWFYADALFIIDPWMWLLAASSVVLARSESRLGVGGWAVLGCATSGLVLGVGEVPLGVKVGWLIGVSLIVGMRLSGWFRQRSPRVAHTTLALLLGYVGTMIATSAVTANLAGAQLGKPHAEVDAFSSPVPGNPFARDGVVHTPDHYLLYRADWLADEPIELAHPPLPVAREPGPIIDAAVQAEQVRGFTHWMRYPTFVAEEVAEGYRVTIRDLRYAAPDAESGFGFARIWLDTELNPIRAVVNPRPTRSN